VGIGCDEGLAVLDTSAAAAVAARYSLGADAVLSGSVARGEQGQVWRLETSRGAWAVKELFVSQTETSARADAEYQDAVRTAGVPMPRVVRTTEGDVLSDLGPALVRVYEWVDLCAPDMNLDPASVGRVVGSIHGVRVPAAGPVDPWHSEPVGSDRWDVLVHTLETNGAPFAAGLARMRDELVALEQLLEPPADLQVCHCDLWADNVVGTPAGGVCVIDWENCGPADPGQELGMVLFEFASEDARRARSLYETYVDAGGPGRVEQPGDFSMAIAQIHHIAEMDCEAWLEPTASPTERQRHVGRMAEFISRPLTRTVIDDLLDAVRPSPRRRHE
jgi:Ser/Thr protein kinase RdoA (MazF antagonist)